MLNTRFSRFAGWCGVAGPILSWGMIFHAIALSPWFNWHTNALSDLGIYPRASALWFNASLILSGVLMLVLLVGVGQWLGPGPLSRAAKIMSAVAAIALGLIGVFPANHPPFHWLAAATYFLATPVAFGLLGAANLRRGLRAHGLLTASAGVAAFLVIAAMPHDGFAVPELIAGLLLGTRVFSMGVQLLTGDQSCG